MIRMLMRTTLSNAAFALVLGLLPPADARAGEEEAKSLLKAMSDYLASQQAISFAYDTNLEVVTEDHQKLLLASSGKIELGRPDSVRREWAVSPMSRWSSTARP